VAPKNARAGELVKMTNAQLYLAIGLPTIAVLASLVISLVQISSIREDIREIGNDIKLLTGKVYELMEHRG
jgi:hypothetical protein